MDNICSINITDEILKIFIKENDFKISEINDIVFNKLNNLDINSIKNKKIEIFSDYSEDDNNVIKEYLLNKIDEFYNEKTSKNNLFNAIVNESKFSIFTTVSDNKDIIDVKQNISLDHLEYAKIYTTTLRNGQSIISDTSVVLLGDVKAGAKIEAKGNIIVIGSVKGNLYAGTSGDKDAFIYASLLNPIQLRIANVVSINTSDIKKPSVAFLKDGNILIKEN